MIKESTDKHYTCKEEQLYTERITLGHSLFGSNRCNFCISIDIDYWEFLTLPIWADHDEDDEQPDVGKEGEDHGDDEDRVGLDSSGLLGWDDSHADSGDGEKIESSGAPGGMPLSVIIVIHTVTHCNKVLRNYQKKMPSSFLFFFSSYLVDYLFLFRTSRNYKCDKVDIIVKYLI